MNIFIRLEFENIKDKLEALGYRWSGMFYIKDLKLSHLSTEIKELKSLGINQIELKDIMIN